MVVIDMNQADKRRDRKFREQTAFDFAGDKPRQSVWAKAVQPAIEQADENADSEWKEAADDVIANFADIGLAFTSDDVVESLELRNVNTHNLSALGPRFLAASRTGVIRKTGRRVQSRIPRRHRELVEWIGANKSQF